MKDKLAFAILAAGSGSRMKSEKPKVLQQIAHKSMLKRVTETVRSQNPDFLTTVVRYKKEDVAAEALSVCDSQVITVQDEINGTGRAADLAGQSLMDAGFSDGTFVVITADTPLLKPETLSKLLDMHTAHNNSATFLTTVVKNPAGYGRIIRNSEGEFVKIVEELDANDAERTVNEINVSVYAFDFVAFRDFIKQVKSDNKKGEIYITDVLSAMNAERVLYANDAHTLFANHVPDEKRIRIEALVERDYESLEGANDFIQLAAQAKVFNTRICHKHMLNGVSIQDPETVWIDSEVQIAVNAVIHANTHLIGDCVIEEGAEIGPNTVLRDVVVHKNATVLSSDVTGAEIGENATVGPFSYIRAGTKMGESSKIGAYTETKALSLGARSKIPHLSYAGDAEIGEGTNFGCGSIIANYDGVHKHKTRVGSNARIGSNTIFVAPVEVGDNVYTGAGSVVRENVPDGALAYSENSLTVREGWTEENR